ncbi:DUF222 domain-containing protein [Conyzicola sp.]|uniref:HNH endonuclease signature motif containing protein n=1 Tax=Conyzicola sp. TaxID=1969404 RepID=UPI003989E1C0
MAAPDRIPGSVNPYSSSPYAQRRALFAEFLDEAEIADRQLSVTMAKRARRIDELRRVSVSIAADESDEDATRPPQLRVDQGKESGWSIGNRAKTELATELATALNLSKNAARTLLAESETLVADLPLTLGALDDGAIRYEHARVIASTAWSLPPESRAAFEAELVPLAATLILTVFRARVLTTRERIHAETMQERHERAAAFRNVSIELGEDGSGYLTLRDSNEVIAAIYNRVTDIALVKVKDDPRTLAQRRADVATEILIKGDLCAAVDDDADPTSSDGKRLGHGIVANVHIEVPVLTLLGLEAAPATLEGKVPIDPATARKLVADAPGFFRLLTDPITGSIVAFDDTFRFLPASLRRAVRLVDRTCTGPWCDATPKESDGHHPSEWQESHDTSLDNSALLCKPDHRLVHNTRWTMNKLPDGDKQWISPCGRIRRVAPLRRLSPAFVEALKPDPRQREEAEGGPAAAWESTEYPGEEPMPF